GRGRGASAGERSDGPGRGALPSCAPWGPWVRSRATAQLHDRARSTMAGTSGRFTTVIKAKISKMLDRAEDPGETLDYSYQQQLESLQNVKKGIADVVTAKKRLQMQSGKLEQSVVK